MLNLNFIPRFDMISSDAGSIKTLAAQSSPNLRIGYPPSPSNMSSDYSGNEFATPDPRIWSPLVPDEHDIHSLHPSMTRDSSEVKPAEPSSTVYHNIQLKEDRPEHGSREERRFVVCIQNGFLKGLIFYFISGQLISALSNPHRI